MGRDSEVLSSGTANVYSCAKRSLVKGTCVVRLDLANDVLRYEVHGAVTQNNLQFKTVVAAV